LFLAPGVAPKGFSGVNFTGPTSIFVSWGSLSQEELQGKLSAYELRYQAFSVADEELLEPPPEQVGIVHGNSVTFTGLSTYTTYKVSVAAISGGGKGVPSRLLYVGKYYKLVGFEVLLSGIQPLGSKMVDNK
jgi:hypothetical protein